MTLRFIAGFFALSLLTHGCSGGTQSDTVADSDTTSLTAIVTKNVVPALAPVFDHLPSALQPHRTERERVVMNPATAPLKVDAEVARPESEITLPKLTVEPTPAAVAVPVVVRRKVAKSTEVLNPLEMTLEASATSGDDSSSNTVDDDSS
jgi:hypothetical protein